MTDEPTEPGRDNDVPCEKNHCHGKRRQGEPGDVCHRPAGWGTQHVGIGRCKLHGGNTRNHVAAAQLEKARRAVVTFGLPREVAPDVALLEEVHRTAGHVAWLGEVVAGLDEDDVTWGLAEEVRKGSGEFPGTDVTQKAAVNVWVQLYQAERKHLVSVCKAAIDAGIEERRVKLAEQQGALLAGAVEKIAGTLLNSVLAVLSEADDETARRASDAVRQAWPAWLAASASKELRAVAAGGDAA